MDQVFDHNSKTVTIISDSGVKVSVQAAVFSNLCVRKDGGLSVWRDGRPAAETVRVDSTGLLIGRNRKPIGAKERRRLTRKPKPQGPKRDALGRFTS